MAKITCGMTVWAFLHITEYWAMSPREERNENSVLVTAESCWTWSFQKMSRSRRDVPIIPKASIESFSAWAPSGRKVASDVWMNSASEVLLFCRVPAWASASDGVLWLIRVTRTTSRWFEKRRWKLLRLHVYIAQRSLVFHPQHRYFLG